MRPIMAVLLICLFGCGGASFRGTFGVGNTVFSVTGFVGFIELTTVPNTTIPVTIVTFLPDFIPVTTVIFCGDLTQQLFLDDFATVRWFQILPLPTAGLALPESNATLVTGMARTMALPGTS